MSKPRLPEHKLDVKIIAIDLDDTLLKDDLTVGDFTVATIQKAAERGIYIVLASGRTENAILPYVRRLDIAGWQAGRFIISQNGASIFDLHLRQSIYSRIVDAEVLLHADKVAHEHGLISEVYDSSTIFTREDNEYTQLDAKLSGLKMQVLPNYTNFLKQGHPKMVIPGDPEHLLQVQAQLKAELKDRAVVFTSKPYFLEVLPANTGKGEALQYLAETKLGIPHTKTMCFGDGMNDESMIRYAEHSVAMINGHEEIIRIARYVTDKTNDQDGTGYFIQQFCL